MHSLYMVCRVMVLAAVLGSLTSLVIAQNATPVIRQATPVGRPAAQPARPTPVARPATTPRPAARPAVTRPAAVRPTTRPRVTARPVALPVAQPVAQPRSIVSTGIHTYRIPLFRKEMKFNTPTQQWSYWFEVKKGMEMTGPATLDLYFANSSTIRTGQSSLSVFFNDSPIASRALLPMQTSTDVIHWTVQLPMSEMKVGFNEVRLTARIRSFEGLCRDFDHDANWLKFLSPSTLTLHRRELSNYPLYCYPFPFMDPLEDNPAQATLILPSNPTAEEIAAMLEIASDWGARTPFRRLPLRVKTQNVPFGNRMELLLGDLSRWNNLPALGKTGEGGVLWNLTNAGALTKPHLLVTGARMTDVARATRALTQPVMMDQMESSPVAITEEPTEAEQLANEKLGQFKLADMGYKEIKLSGAFNQQFRFTVRRPLGMRIGKESMVQLKFRHSASLNPALSTLTVYVNTTPIGSARLDATNIKDGTLSVRIPVKELIKDTWDIVIDAYNNIGDIDCGKRYDAVAWTVIDGANSSVTLMPGSLDYTPALDGFPYLTGADGLVPQPVTCWLPAGPTDQELTTAAIIAARAGQQNRLSLKWRVALGDQLGEYKDATSVLMIAQPTEMKRFEKLKDSLLVLPQMDGSYVVDPRLAILAPTLRGACIFQAVPSPWTKKGVLYVVMAPSVQAMTRAQRYLVDEMPTVELENQAAIITEQGRLVSFPLFTPAEKEAQITHEADRYTWPMLLISGLGISIFLSLVWWVVGLFRKRTPKVDTAVAGDTKG